LVRLPDDALQICQQATAWRGLELDGERFEWCEALTQLPTGTKCRTVAIRFADKILPVIGEALPADGKANERIARAVLERRRRQPD
jgi:hypothetical protein